MELAFFGPVQIVLVMAILLILFGPQKMPEIGAQLGRALRELRRSTQEITDAMRGATDDDTYNRPYEPPRYDDTTNYGTDYNGSAYNTGSGDNSHSSGVKLEKWEPFQAEGSASTSTGSVEQTRGDFASPALADAAPEVHAASGRVPRSKG